jgi:hypothetical protein
MSSPQPLLQEMESQQQWLMTRMKAAAPQALLVAD